MQSKNGERVKKSKEREEKLSGLKSQAWETKNWWETQKPLELNVAIHHIKHATWPRHVWHCHSTLNMDTTEISRVTSEQMIFHILKIVITIKDELRIWGN